MLKPLMLATCDCDSLMPAASLTVCNTLCLLPATCLHACMLHSMKGVSSRLLSGEKDGL